MTGCGPFDTVRLTPVPDFTDAPASGSLLMTTPAATVSLQTSVGVPSARWALLSAAAASAAGVPASLGTV